MKKGGVELIWSMKFSELTTIFLRQPGPISTDVEKSSKFIWKHKIPRIAKAVLSKTNKDMAIPNFKL